MIINISMSVIVYVIGCVLLNIRSKPRAARLRATSGGGELGDCGSGRLRRIIVLLIMILILKIMTMIILYCLLLFMYTHMYVCIYIYIYIYMYCLFAPLSAHHRQRVHPRAPAHPCISPNPVENSASRSIQPLLSIRNSDPDRTRPRSRLNFNFLGLAPFESHSLGPGGKPHSLQWG